MGYNAKAYGKVNPRNGVWPGKVRKLWGVWGNRVVRWMGGWGRHGEKRLVEKRLEEWRTEERQPGEEEHVEVGQQCIVNEMQVLVGNGWEHV